MDFIKSIYSEEKLCKYFFKCQNNNFLFRKVKCETIGVCFSRYLEGHFHLKMSLMMISSPTLQRKLKVALSIRC